MTDGTFSAHVRQWIDNVHGKRMTREWYASRQVTDMMIQYMIQIFSKKHDPIYPNDISQ